MIDGGNTLGYRLPGVGYDRFGGTTTSFHIATIGELGPLMLLLAWGARFNRPANDEVHR